MRRLLTGISAALALWVGAFSSLAAPHRLADAPGAGFIAAATPRGEPASAPHPAPSESPAVPATAPPRRADPVPIVIGLFMFVAAGASLMALHRRGLFRRDAFLNPPRRDVAAFPALAWLLLGALVFVALGVGGKLAARALPPFAQWTLRESVLAALAAYAAAILVILVAVAVRPRAFTAAGFRARPADLLIGAGALLVTYPIVYSVNTVSGWIARLISHFTGAPPPTELAHTTLRSLAAGPRDLWWFLTVASVIIAAPIIEELLHRGLIQSALTRRFGPGWPAIILTSILFTLIHVGAAGAHALPGLFALSLSLGVLFEKTGRLGAPIAMHALFNTLNITLALASNAPNP